MNQPSFMSPPKSTSREFYPSSNMQDLVLKFHRAFQAPAANMPTILSEERGKLRVKMLTEEIVELHDAVNDQDIVQQYDALLDILVLAMGGLVEMGLDAHPGFAEVMRANMSKLDANGQPIHSRGEELDGYPAGKILKGPNYREPDLFLMMIAQGWVPSPEDYEIERLRVQAMNSRSTGVEWDIDRNQPMHITRALEESEENRRLEKHASQHTTVAADRKDNFSDRVATGWLPNKEQQIAYETHRMELEKRYPTTKWVGEKLVVIDYTNGEKDVDWDFETNAPRAKKLPMAKPGNPKRR